MAEATSDIGRRRAAALREGTADYQKRRREIARAAARVFNERGFQGTSVSAVAEAMGTDRASLYYYISSKEELFDEVVREASEANVARAEAIRDSAKPAPEKLRALIVELMCSYEEHYPLLYVYIREDLRQTGGKRTAWSKHMQGLNRRYEDAVISIVSDGFDEGSLRRVGPPRVVAFGIMGMTNWTNRWFNPERSEISGEEIGLAYADIVLAGLQVRSDG
jgi:TetR/AcrR family transcriptional regulator, cholesterol catabolism regulator